jgi:ubiquinone/menaquinone biosynthesis C-methylase UbiE
MVNYYPESKVEIKGFTARHYDAILNTATLGIYPFFIREAVELMDIKPQDRILDMAAGTGRNACLMIKKLSPQGEIVGVDISREMVSQFRKKCANYPNVKILHDRIDRALYAGGKFDKVLISFALHGFPHQVRKIIIENAFAALKTGGSFLILDYNTFSYSRLSFYFRLLFKTIECPYAFDFVRRDWERILTEYSFGDFKKSFFFNKFLRLLIARKTLTSGRE